MAGVGSRASASASRFVAAVCRAWVHAFDEGTQVSVLLPTRTEQKYTMEEHGDQDMDGVPHDEAYLPLSEDEQKILALYDKLQELRLEIAIINAQQSRKNSQSITPGALGDSLLMSPRRCSKCCYGRAGEDCAE